MKTYRKKINKVSKGYRLKPETHKLVYKIQRAINGDQDEAIMAACTAFFRTMQMNNEETNKSENPLIKAA